jgi:hypothetical protein
MGAVIPKHAQRTSANRPSRVPQYGTAARSANRGTGSGGRWQGGGEHGRVPPLRCDPAPPSPLAFHLWRRCRRRVEEISARGFHQRRAAVQRADSCHGSSWTDHRGAGQCSRAQAKKFASSGCVTCRGWYRRRSTAVRIVLGDGVAVGPLPEPRACRRHGSSAGWMLTGPKMSGQCLEEPQPRKLQSSLVGDGSGPLASV